MDERKVNIWETNGAKKGLFHSGNPRKLPKWGKMWIFQVLGLSCSGCGRQFQVKYAVQSGNVVRMSNIPCTKFSAGVGTIDQMEDADQNLPMGAYA